MTDQTPQPGTPLPWELQETYSDEWQERGWCIRAGDKFVASVDRDNAVWLAEGEADANAAYIVYAVNALPRLREAAEEAVVVLEDRLGGYSAEELRAWAERNPQGQAAVLFALRAALGRQR